MVPPNSGYPVDEWLGGMRVLVDVRHREIGNDVSVGQCREGQQDKAELHDGRRYCRAHEAGVMAREAPSRQNQLDDGDGERQKQREMANLNNHVARSPPVRYGFLPGCPGWIAPLPSATPLALSAFATSGGI